MKPTFARFANCGSSDNVNQLKDEGNLGRMSIFYQMMSFSYQ